MPVSSSPNGRDPFAAAFGASRVAMAISDPRQPDDPIVFVNEAFCELTGYGTDEVLGRNCRFLQGPLTDRAAIGRVRAAIASGEGIQIEVLNYRKDGSTFWNEMVISAVRGERGEVEHFFASQSDVTEKHETARRLVEARDGLEGEVARRTADLQRALDQQTALLHEVDHRVKNNLQVISSLVLLKARRIHDPGARAVLQSMAERISALATVHRLLYPVGDVSRFNLRDFATDFAADIMATADPARLALDLDVDPIAVSAAKAAPLALLVHELATNAVRHAFPEGRRGRVVIAAKRLGDEIRLTITDDGIGIAAGTPNPDGFGRTLVDMVVRQLRGTLSWDDTRPGTRAAIALPLNAEEALI